MAVSISDRLTLFDIEKSVILTDIKFDNYLNNIEFSLFDTNLILMTNQTNSLMIYNIEKEKLENSLRNDLNTTFISVCSLENQPIIVTGSSDCTLSIYEYKYNQSSLIKKIFLESLYAERRTKQKENDEEEEEETNASLLCVGLQLFNLGNNSRIEFNQARKSLNAIIVCATPVCLFFIDFSTGNLIYLVDFNDVSFKKSLNNECFLMPQCVDFSLVNNKQINAAFLFLFQNEISIVKCAEISSHTTTQSNIAQESNGEIEEILSVYPKASLLKESPLNEDIKEKVIKKVPSLHEYFRSTSLTKKPAGLDRPLTFNSKIKSSGYNQPSLVREKFTPLINKSNRGLSLSSIELPSSNTKTMNSKQKTNENLKLEFNFELPMVLDKKINASDKSKAIVLMKYSSDGQNLCLSSADNIVQWLTVNNLEKPGPVFNTHKETVRSIDISHDCKYLLTASEDKTCKLWSVKKTNDLIIDIRSLKTSDNKVIILFF